jgi:DNA repair exonuclease SbcCD nuclease subunit
MVSLTGIKEASYRYATKALDSAKSTGTKAALLGALAAGTANTDAYGQDSRTNASEAGRAKVVLLAADNNSPTPRPVDLVTFDDGRYDPAVGLKEGKEISLETLAKKATSIGADRTTVLENLRLFPTTTHAETHLEDYLLLVKRNILKEEEAIKLLECPDIKKTNSILADIKEIYRVGIAKARESAELSEREKLSPAQLAEARLNIRKSALEIILESDLAHLIASN